MNWDHAVSWGRGAWFSVSDIGRVGSGWPTGNETIQFPQATRGKKKICRAALTLKGNLKFGKVSHQPNGRANSKLWVCIVGS